MSSFERPGYSDQSSNSFDTLRGGVGEILHIDTPEQVELQYSVAGVGSRFVAVLLDHAIQFGFLLVEFLLFAWIGSTLAGGSGNGKMDSAGAWFLGILGLINFCVLVLYFAFFEAYWNGQTPGKRVMKLRVIKDSGRQITFFEALARNLVRFVELFVPGLYLTGAVTMLCNKRHKRLGDYVAGTLVVHERVDEQPLMVHSTMNLSNSAMTAQLHEPWREAVPAMFPADAVARLSGQDLMVIETFFSRMLDLTLETRAAIAYRMAAQMTAKMGVVLPEGSNPERALESMAYQMRSGGR